jgi:hypothetical protein
LSVEEIESGLQGRLKGHECRILAPPAGGVVGLVDDLRG